MQSKSMYSADEIFWGCYFCPPARIHAWLTMIEFAWKPYHTTSGWVGMNTIYHTNSDLTHYLVMPCKCFIFCSQLWFRLSGIDAKSMFKWLMINFTMIKKKCGILSQFRYHYLAYELDMHLCKGKPTRWRIHSHYNLIQMVDYSNIIKLSAQSYCIKLRENLSAVSWACVTCTYLISLPHI